MTDKNHNMRGTWRQKVIVQGEFEHMNREVCE